MRIYAPSLHGAEQLADVLSISSLEIEAPAHVILPPCG